MIKYYKLYGRIGKLGNKYTNEAENMHWMDANDSTNVFSFEEIKSYLLSLSLSDFITELIKIFKEDGLWHEALSLCLGLKDNGEFKEGELDFQESKICCKIIPEEHPHSSNVATLEVEIFDPYPQLLEINELKERTKYKVDDLYDFELNLNRNSEGDIMSLSLNHIKNQINKSI